MNGRELAVAVAATRTWQEAAASGEAVAAALDAGRAAVATGAPLLDGSVVYSGAGSSYYAARVAAAAHRRLLDRPALAAPLSELLLRPDTVLTDRAGAPATIVTISRSGRTSEAVDVARRFTAAGHVVVAVTCRPAAPLAVAATHVLISPLGDEASVVMTRSFTSMLALVLRVIAGLAPGDEAARVAAELDTLPSAWAEAAGAARLAPWIASARPWSRVVALGGGCAAGIAAEARLKLTETGRIPVDAYAPLEFRHGPMSLAEPGVLALAILGGPGAAEEAAVVREVAAKGASAWILGDRGGEAQAAPDPPGPPDPSELASLVAAPGGIARTPVGRGRDVLAAILLAMPAIQSLALSIAIARGEDPDAPRHLGQVVVLGDA